MFKNGPLSRIQSLHQSIVELMRPNFGYVELQLQYFSVTHRANDTADVQPGETIFNR